MVSSGKATLRELAEVYTLNDLWDFHELIDYEIDQAQGDG